MNVNGVCLRVLGFCAAFHAGAGAQSAGHARYMERTGQSYVFRYRHGSGAELVEGMIPIEVASPEAPMPLKQVVTLPGGAGSIKLLRILPRAVREQTVEPDKDVQSPPAVQICVDGPAQSNKAWVIANDPERNRLTSLIAGWRYAATPNKKGCDRLHKEFETELTRPAVVSVSRADGSGCYEMPAESDTKHDVTELGCKVRIKDFLPHFAMDKKTKKPVNQSDKRMNPAVLVEIQFQGKWEERRVFARFPDSSMGVSDAIPFDVRLDCPVDAANPLPSFLLVTVARRQHELWSRADSGHKRAPLMLEDKIPIPATNDTFHLARFIPFARLVETFSPTNRRGTVTALGIEFTDASSDHSALWLEVGRRRLVKTRIGPIVVELAAANPASHSHERASHWTP